MKASGTAYVLTPSQCDPSPITIWYVIFSNHRIPLPCPISSKKYFPVYKTILRLMNHLKGEILILNPSRNPVEFGNLMANTAVTEVIRVEPATTSLTNTIYPVASSTTND